MQDCEKLMQTQSAPEAHREMALLLSNLCQWIDGSSSNLGDYSDFNSASKVWTGTEIIAVFNIYNIGTKRYTLRWKHSY